jgi:hypothetical protein
MTAPTMTPATKWPVLCSRSEGITNALKGYLRADFEDDFGAYLPPVAAKKPSSSATTRQTNIFSDLEAKRSATNQLDVADENGPNELEENNCRVVGEPRGINAQPVSKFLSPAYFDIYI